MTENKETIQNNDALAISSIADAYYRGFGMPVNYKEAFRYYRKAAEMGYPEAMTRMGVCYEKGQGVEQNYEEALTCYEDAADAGNVEAVYRIGDLYWNGVHSLMQMDRQYASSYYLNALAMVELSGEQDDAPNVYLRVANCVRNGIGTAKDPETARLLYQIAADGFYERIVGGETELEELLEEAEDGADACAKIINKKEQEQT